MFGAKVWFSCSATDTNPSTNATATAARKFRLDQVIAIDADGTVHLSGGQSFQVSADDAKRLESRLIDGANGYVA